MTTFRWPGTWDPFSPWRSMQRELERLFSRGALGEGRNIGGGVYPPLNVLNGPDEILVECEVPGIRRDQLELSITGETLVIKGTKSPSAPEAEDADESVQYHRQERGAGDFSRTIVLPDKVEADQISADLTDGILAIHLPKSAGAVPQKIQIQ